MKVLFLNPPFKFKISRESRWPEQEALKSKGIFFYFLRVIGQTLGVLFGIKYLLR
ncbi:MAG: hypothetical protein QXS48_01235 [Candidatus Aenigmatarchaeota archaeon]